MHKEEHNGHLRLMDGGPGQELGEKGLGVRYGGWKEMEISGGHLWDSLETWHRGDYGVTLD